MSKLKRVLKNIFLKIKRIFIMPIPILSDGTIDRNSVSHVSKMLLGGKPVIFMLIEGRPEYFGDSPELTRLIRQSGIVMAEITTDDIQILSKDDLTYKPEESNKNFYDPTKKY